jgi:hypothetical protein
MTIVGCQGCCVSIGEAKILDFKVCVRGFAAEEEETGGANWHGVV